MTDLNIDLPVGAPPVPEPGRALSSSTLRADIPAALGRLGPCNDVHHDLAAEHVAFCPDQIDPQDGRDPFSPRTHARTIRRAHPWRSWWD